jgi:hypothetical protein
MIGKFGRPRARAEIGASGDGMLRFPPTPLQSAEARCQVLLANILTI